MIRLGAVGDVVRTLPAVSALRAAYGEAQITWLVEPAASSVLSAQPWIDRVLVFPRDRIRAALRGGRVATLAAELSAFLRPLRMQRFDLVLDFHAILKSGLLALATGAPRRASFARPFARELSWLFATERARLRPAHASRFERNDGLLRFLGVPLRHDPAPLRVPSEASARMRAALGPGPPPLAVHPGTSPDTPHKRWSPAAYAEVIRTLHGERGLQAVVSFGPDPAERAVAADVVRRSLGAARLAPETASLGELAALFAASRLYLGGDTGPMHVASLVGTPVLQILGPTDPVENAPWPGVASRSVRAGLPCSPCRRGCAAAACMGAVPPEAVVAAARELLDAMAGPVAAVPAPS